MSNKVSKFNFGRTLTLLALIGLLSPAAAETVFRYDDFNNVEHLNILNDAFRTGSQLRLTEAAQYQNGTANYENAVFLRDGFETTFTFAIYSQAEGGADGLAFIIQTAGATETGPAVGYIPYGIPGAVVLELDTWKNDGLGDSNDNHISLQAVGPTPDGSSAFSHANSLGITTSIPNLSNGAIHRVRIQYRPGLLSVYVDQSTSPDLSVAVDLTDVKGSSALDPGGFAYVGLAAGTGGAYETHDIFSWSFELPGAPSLSIVPSGVQLQITWPTAATGFLLQSATTLANGADWQDFPTPPTETNGQKVLNITPTGPCGFFRLHKP